MKLLDHTGLQHELFRRAKDLVRPCGTVLDVGCGLRPQALVACRKHVCVEPHFEYAEVLEATGFEVVRDTGSSYLEICEPVDTVVALDVIEHMLKADGKRFIQLAKEKALKQVVIFTPLGFMPQEETGEVDAWGGQGQYWQRHKSGWLPEEFEGWATVVDKDFHRRDGETYGAFFAVFTH